MLDLHRLIGQGTTRAFAGGVVYLPAIGNESVEAAAKFKCRLDGKVGEIVLGKERRVPAFLFLPGHRTIGTNTSQHPAAIGALGDLNGEHHSCFHNDLYAACQQDGEGPFQ